MKVVTSIIDMTESPKKPSLLSQLQFARLVLLVSVVNVILFFYNRNYGVLIISFIGILSYILYDRQRYAYRGLIYFWIFSQLINIKVEKYSSQTNHTGPVYDVTQTYYKLNFGVTFPQSDGSLLVINISLIAILFLILFRINELMLVYWKPLSLYMIMQGSTQTDAQVLTGVILNKMFKRRKEKWLLVKTDYELHIFDKVYTDVLIARKDHSLLFPFTSKQTVYVKLSEYPITKAKEIDTLVLMQDLGFDCICELAIASRIKISL